MLCFSAAEDILKICNTRFMRSEIILSEIYDFINNEILHKFAYLYSFMIGTIPWIEFWSHYNRKTPKRAYMHTRRHAHKLTYTRVHTQMQTLACSYLQKLLQYQHFSHCCLDDSFPLPKCTNILSNRRFQVKQKAIMTGMTDSISSPLPVMYFSHCLLRFIQWFTISWNSALLVYRELTSFLAPGITNS